MSTINVLTPTYEADATGQVTMAPRSMPTEPVVITVLENAKPNAKALLTYVAEGLRDRLPVADIVVHSKSAAGKPIDADDAEMLAARSHLVISGLGDWGACTACSLHDAVQMEALGVPAMLLITEPFEPIVASFAPTVGMAEYPAVTVPHPVSSLDDDDLRKLAASVIDEAVARLTT